MKSKKLIILSMMSLSVLPFSQKIYSENSITSITQQTTKQIKGAVYSVNGEPLIGVNISVEGTTNGTITDLDGGFSLSVPTNATLVVSYIGYKVMRITDLNKVSKIVLSEDNQALDEIVVIGYGVSRKSDLTGSVGQIDSKAVVQRQVVNPVDALSGKIAGVIVNNNSGRPGGSININIRGFNSINASNAPLFVIDGVVGADIAMINPNDIETMNVLKDASSTAIYGARGAGGVVLITTKKGSFNSGTTVNYNLNLGISKAQNKIDLLNSDEFMQVLNKSFENDGFEQVDWNRVNPHLFNKDNTPIYNTDWQDQMMKNAFSNRHFLSVSHGNENSKTTVSVGYQNENGILRNSDLQKFTGKISSTFKINKIIELTSSLSYNNARENRYDDWGVGGMTAPRTMIECFPVLPIYYPDGKNSIFADFKYPSTLMAGGKPAYNAQGQKMVDYDNLGAFWGYGDNPVKQSTDLQRKLLTDQLLGNSELTINIIDGLVFRTNGALEVKWGRENLYTGKELIESSAGGANASIGINNHLYWQNENFLTYDKSWGLHKMNAMIGASWSGAQNQYLGGSGQGFSSDFFTWNNLGIAEKPGIPRSSFSEWKMNSYYFRGNYSYAGKYLATVSMRYDGSSVFGSANRYAYFPSGALAWVIKEEDFLKDNNTISNLKLRASVGKTGNAGIGAYSTLATLNNTRVVFGDKMLQNGVVQGRMPNSNLKWETTTQYDAGADLGLFDNRLSIMADFYYKKTTDLLLEKPVSWASGYSSVMDNIGSVTNKGFELTLNTHNVKSKDWNWYSTLIFSTNKNEVVKLAGDESDLWVGGFIGINYLLVRKGESLNSVYGLVRSGSGTWGSNEVEEAARYSKQPGDKKYVDKNNDGKIDYQNDGEILGNAYPNFEMSFSNTVTYKNFDLTLDLQGKYGNKAVNMTKITDEQRTWYANTTKKVLNFWTPENQNTVIERPRTCMPAGGSSQELQIDDDLVEDASYIRFKNLIFGYTFPAQIAQKAYLKGLRVYFNMENFLVLTKYTGYDPEVSNMSGQGAEFYSHPKPMNINLGVNVTF